MTTQLEVKIPKTLSEATAAQVAEDLIDFIIERTKEGKGKDGKKFPKYSKAYMESLDFKIAGKSGLVDLTLSGEMLDSMEVVSVAKGKVVIGYKSDNPMVGRAEGNILGSYGGNPDSKKARDFLSLSAKEIDNVLKEYPVQDEETRARKATESEVARSISKDIVDSFDFYEMDFE